MKTIKFNLNVNNQMIRSVDELHQNFNIDDIYELYESKILQKWLRINNENDLAKQLDSIENESDLSEKILKILSIFNFTTSDSELRTYAYLYKRAYRERVAFHSDQENLFEDNISHYHKNYTFLKNRLAGDENYFSESYSEDEKSDKQLQVNDVNHQSYSKLANALSLVAASSLLDSKDDNDVITNESAHTLNYIKATIEDIAETSLELFKLDVGTFFDEFIEHKPIVIMCCLMNEKLREVLWSQTTIKEQLSALATDQQMIGLLKPYLSVYEGSTDGMWKYIGEKDKHYLIIRISGNCKVGEQHALDIDHSYTDINGEYEILQGLLFKSTSISQYVYYIEV